MAYEYKIGDKYRTSEGRCAEVICIDILNKNPNGNDTFTAAMLITAENGDQHVAEFLPNGNPVVWNNGKIIGPWEQPELFYKPVFRDCSEHPDIQWWKNIEEMYEYIGKTATADNPLLGILRWNKTWNELRLEKRNEAGE